MPAVRYAAPATPRHLAWENIGLQTDSRGQLEGQQHVSDRPPVTYYAVGDVIRYPSPGFFAAYDQGRIAAQALVKGEASAHLIEEIPTGIYTIRKSCSVGKTEQQLHGDEVPYEVGRAQFKHLARAQIVGNERWYAEDPVSIVKPRRSFGIHCFGERAAEIIHIGQAIMEHERRWQHHCSTSSTPPLTTRQWRKQ